MKVILASGSPRRKALMELAEIDCIVIPSEFDESKVNSYSIEETSLELALGKAKDVFDNTQDDRAVIGADTIVVKDDKIYGKPKDREDAIRMLKELSGGVHSVYTSIAVLIEDRGKNKKFNEIIKTDVYVSEIDEEDIEKYVDTERPFDKAGAYAIQSSFSKFIEKIDGDYMSVVGLPINRIYTILKENDVMDDDEEFF